MGMLKTPEQYIEEDRLKKEFITNMSDKYDYRAYERFCIASGMTPLSFSMFALFVDPVKPPSPVPNVDILTNSPCSGCGGGKIV